MGTWFYSRRPFSHSRGYLLLGGPSYGESESLRCAVRDLPALLAQSAEAIVVFKVPESVVARLPGESLFERRGLRMVALVDCQGQFPLIWREAGEAEVFFMVFVSRKGLDKEVLLADVRRYLKGLYRIWWPTADRMMKYDNQFIAESEKPYLFFAGGGIDTGILMVASEEFYQLADLIVTHFGGPATPNETGPFDEK